MSTPDDLSSFDGPSALDLGLGRLNQGDEEGARVAFLRARDAFLAADEPVQASIAEGNAGAMAFGAGDLIGAGIAFRAALGRLEMLGRPLLPELQLNFARVLAALGQLQEALERCVVAARVAHEEGELATEGLAWGVRAELLAEAGRADDAAIDLARSVVAYEAGGVEVEAVRARVDLGAAHYRAGRLREAADAFAGAYPPLAAWGDPEDLIALLVNLGGVYYELHDHALAAQVLDDAAARLPESLADSFLAVRLRANRGPVLLTAGRFDEAEADLKAAREGYRALGQHEREAHQLAMLSNVRRYQADLQGAIALQEEVMALEQAHGFRVREVAGLMYSGVSDRALHVDTAAEAAQSVAEGGRQLPPAELVALPSQHPRASDGEGPVLIVALPSYGAFGAIFPRGAVSVASFLNANGIPSEVLPLAHYVDDFAGGEAARARTLEVLADAIRVLKPRAVGLSVTFTYLYPRGQEVARLVKQIAPDLPVVIGGAHVTYQDREVLEETPELDIVVRGEGEWTALELFRALGAGVSDLTGIHGLTWRSADGVIHRNQHRPLGDVRELPPVDFELLPDAFARVMEISAITSRGCTFRCRYCHEFRYWGGVVREHTVERIVGELDRMASRYGNALCGIDDSMLNMHTPYFFELVGALGRSPNLPERFGFLTRLDTITAPGLQAMRDARIPSLSVGAESGSQAVLDAMNKGLLVQQTVDALTLARDAGIHSNAFFIIGHPGDNIERAAETRAFVDRLFQERLVVWTDLSIFTPYPGTPFFSHPEKYGVEILSKEWSLWRRSNRPIAQLTDYGADQIYLDYLRMLGVQARYLSGRVA